MKAKNEEVNDKIVFEVIEKKKTNQRIHERSNVICIIETIRKCYPDNNEIATKLSAILLETHTIIVNRDINDCKDRPIIVCRTNKGDKVVEIINYHKIIWAHINNWCDED